MNKSAKDKDLMALGCLGAVCIVIVSALITYLFVSLIVWLVCEATGVEFSWLAAAAVFGIAILIRWIFSAAKSK